MNVMSRAAFWTGRLFNVVIVPAGKKGNFRESGKSVILPQGEAEVGASICLLMQSRRGEKGLMKTSGSRCYHTVVTNLNESIEGLLMDNLHKNRRQLDS